MAQVPNLVWLDELLVSAVPVSDLQIEKALGVARQGDIPLELWNDDARRYAAACGTLNRGIRQAGDTLIARQLKIQRVIVCSLLQLELVKGASKRSEGAGWEMVAGHIADYWMDELSQIAL